MTDTAYVEPVSHLLTLGDVRERREWHDYAALGLTAAHVPDLVRMALDEDLLWADSEDVEVWAPLHAWRALGQLRAGEAAEPLTALFDYLDDDRDEWIAEDLPKTMGLIGPAAIPALQDYLADTTHGSWARVAASASLAEIVKHYPQTRAEVIEIISAQLAHFAEQDRRLNACLATDLAHEMRAVEAAPVIERAFAADAVDLSFMGDWEDVQIALGLLKERLTPQQDYMALEMPEFVETRAKMREFLEQQTQKAPSPKQKPGRNDPCWCGSGKKYKHCHLQEDRQGE